MSNTNVVIISGRLTADPELKKTSGGNGYCKFSIANNQWNKSAEKEEPHFFNITAWGKTAENIVQYFSKGSPILINGKLTQSRWESDGKTRSAVEIMLFSFEFMGGKPEGKPAAVHLEDKPASPFSDDDSAIPF